jgi:hypothetical protein
MAIFNSKLLVYERALMAVQAVVALAAPNSEKAQMACQLAGKKGWRLKPGNKYVAK